MAVLPLATNAQQSVGIFGGATVNFLKTGLAGRSFTQTNAKAGFSMGISYEKKLSGWLWAGVRAIYLQKNFSIDRTGIYTGISELNRRSYIQLPIFLSGKTSIGKLQLGIDLGGFGAYWTSAKLEGRIPNIFSVITDPNGLETFPIVEYSERYEFSSSRDNRFEFGAVAGIGSGYPIGGRYSIFVNVDYYHAFTGDQEKYTINTVQSYNRTINIYGGIKIDMK